MAKLCMLKSDILPILIWISFFCNTNNLSLIWRQYKLGKHRSNGLELIQKVPPIEVEGDIAVCDGGGGALGHPLEYIKVGSRGGEPVSCIYCGLRYKEKDAH